MKHFSVAISARNSVLVENQAQIAARNEVWVCGLNFSVKQDVSFTFNHQLYQLLIRIYTLADADDFDAIRASRKIQSKCHALRATPKRRIANHDASRKAFFSEKEEEEEDVSWLCLLLSNF